MVFVGIDIAKLNHFASVISSDGEVLVEPFQFSNDLEGFRSLSLVLDRFERDNLLIGLESTAHYGNNLVEFLVSTGYRFCVINPIQTSTMRKNNIRKTKTDRVDTLDSIIMIVPGMGFVEAGMILGEVGDIRRFSTSGKLLAFAGLDPTVYHSGNFNASRTRMSKRG